MAKHKIYVASSWRNDFYPEVVEALREVGHDVYDFRNPPSGDGGFKWSNGLQKSIVCSCLVHSQSVSSGMTLRLCCRVMLVFLFFHVDVLPIQKLDGLLAKVRRLSPIFQPNRSQN